MNKEKITVEIKELELEHTRLLTKADELERVIDKKMSEQEFVEAGLIELPTEYNAKTTVVRKDSVRVEVDIPTSIYDGMNHILYQSNNLFGTFDEFVVHALRNLVLKTKR